MKSRDVPNTLAQGWGGYSYNYGSAITLLGRGMALGFPSPMAMACSASAPSFLGMKMAMPQASQSAAPVPAPGYQLFLDASVDDASESLESVLPETIQPKDMSDDDKLMQLISIQSFDGSFKLLELLAELLNTSMEDVREGNKHDITFP